MALITDAAKRWRAWSATVAMLVLLAGPAAAQWLKLPLPGTPHLPDGSPNLTAPTPKTSDGKPDLSGIWQADSIRYLENLAGDGVQVPMHPWAAAVYKERQETLGRDKPQIHCMPHGVPDAYLVPGIPFKLIQTPNQLVVLYEEFNTYRQVFTDGRALPNDPNPTWYGYSVGKWVGDTFVVETAGFKEGTWLDNGGYPHTDALRLTERFRRLNFGTMQLDVAIDDSKAYLKPWKSATINFKLMPDTELIEHLCENEKDVPHMVGK